MLNEIVMMGRLTADPELKTTSNEKAYTRFSLAVQRDYAPAGEEKGVDFIPVAMWGKSAESACKFLKKGSQIVVKGRLEVGSFTDKEGNKRTSFQVTGERFYFTESKNSGNQDAKVSNPASNASDVPADVPDYSDFEDLDDDDLPF